MARVQGLQFDHSVVITAAPTRVLAAFFDPSALTAWWQAVRSVTTPRPLGIYAIEWEKTPFQDEVLGTLGGVFYGTVMEFRNGREFFLADALLATTRERSGRPDGARGELPGRTDPPRGCWCVRTARRTACAGSATTTSSARAGKIHSPH